jgi:hypothetical protein
MRIDEIADKKDRVYLRIAKVPGHSGYGKYRVRGMRRVSGGWDVTIQSWTEGDIFYPADGRKGMVLALANNMPISAEAAYEILNNA